MQHSIQPVSKRQKPLNDFFKDLKINPLTPEEQKQIEKQNKLDIQKSINHANRQKTINHFGLRFANCSYDDYEIYDEKQRKAISVCKRFSDNSISPGESLVLMGSAGTGKDHLIAAMLKGTNKKILVTDFETIAEEKIQSQRDGKTWQTKLKAKFKNIEILVLSDFGIRGTLSDSQRDVFYFLLNERYKDMKSVVISTNLNVKQFKEIIDDANPRAYRRLLEMTRFNKNIIAMTWKPFYLVQSDKTVGCDSKRE